jgi:hypothetical protein
MNKVTRYRVDGGTNKEFSTTSIIFIAIIRITVCVFPLVVESQYNAKHLSLRETIYTMSLSFFLPTFFLEDSSCKIKFLRGNLENDQWLESIRKLA